MDALFTFIRKKIFLITLIAICISQVTFAQRGNQSTLQDRTAQNEMLRKTNREELLRISDHLENNWAERKRNVEEFAKKNNIEIRRELPNGKVIQLVDIENGQPLFYTTHNTGAAQTTKANQLWTGGNLGLNLDGSSLPPIGVWDAGAVLSVHQEFINGNNSRITQKDNATVVSNHATHVSGTIAASGVNAKAKGMASNAQLYAYDWSNDAAEMATAAADGMLISSHSYGFTYGWSGNTWYGNTNISTLEDYRFGFYSTHSRNWDNIAYNAPYYLIVKSAGNDRNEGPVNGAYPKDGYPDGYDCIGTDAIGKNILTVGSVSQVSNYSNPSDVLMSSNSGWGPVDDGRIKPDVVGKGVLLYSTTGSSVSGYATMSGTSMATPNVAGTLALLQEYYMQLNGRFMRSATLKALTIHTTDEAGPAPGPDYMFGWGLVNAERAAGLINTDHTDNTSIQELTLENNNSYQIEVYSDGNQPLKATIVWTDPAGKAQSPSLDSMTPALVNDLDLIISGNNSNFYPWKLDRDNPSAPATRNSKNFVDNVEVVMIDNPVPGIYTIKISHEGTLSADQAFSLIISGAQNKVDLAPIAEFSADRITINVGEHVQFNNLTNNDSASYLWEFSGTELLFSTEPNPNVKYISEGIFDVKLTVTDSYGSDTITKAGYITVNAALVLPKFTASATLIYEGETVNFTDQSLNSPISWNWTFQGGTPSASSDQNPSVNYNKAGVYNVKLVVSNSTGNSEILKESYIIVENEEDSSYPEISSLNPNNEWINSVSIGSFNNRNSGPSTYTDFTHQRIMLNEGTSYTIALTPEYSGPRNPINWKIWIDYNNDMIFNEQEEVIFSSTNTRNLIKGRITIPNGVGPIVTRMRIAMSFEEIPISSGSFARGEVEDYTVEISAKASSSSENHDLSFDITSSRVFPNPVSDKLFIHLNNWEPNCMVRLTDLAGRIVYNSTSTDNLKMIDVSDFKKGLYVLTVTDGKNIDSHKVAVH